MQREQLCSLLDHLVGAGEQCRRDVEAKSAPAVGRFIENTNLVDCTTGKSAGFSPLIIRPA